MHVVIINGSPRACQYSNTDKIIRAFVRGLESSGSSVEIYCLSSRREWDNARKAYLANERIIFALPMYVESIPSLMLEFLATLPTQRQLPAELSFIVHGGFDEGHQFRLCEHILASLPEQLGCTYGGCLIKGGSFMLRLFSNDEVERTTQPYVTQGQRFEWSGDFLTPEAAKFTGPERYPWIVRQITALVLKFLVNRKFERFADEWGCTTSLDHQVYSQQ